ncbi:thiol:disulfide interchange protein DsbA/DsbL [Psychromonas sp. 14N.309.X.WAT.B.A12]|uniref:thiol:disulfide interchange protein DsbA/DsbL n=1 Tax=unclassified Psychromonas TaxID=2614957 RepID=UPI0025B148DC|nr:thiol:disulfide interchange protein DsbA/DsbL [Psychromonas sp. 14N.309.X.WAT.B.A12]MDN2664763.1 thiol:disulfide interchange protein DsbA/DsbL [Psychromonas sp. 14N.309.X.WAT.B.A12]
MKKVFALLIGLFLLPLSVQAADFEEGTHYDVIKQTATDKPEVLEFFSFYCPHCFKFEPLMKNLEKELPADVAVKKSHVNFLGGAMADEVTKAYAAADLLDVKEEVTSIIFDQIHVQRKAINNEQDILDIFAKAGISEKEAKGALASFPVNGMAAQMKRNTETFKVRGVPTLIVNGKYKVNTGSVKSTQEFVELVKFLTKKTD